MAGKRKIDEIQSAIREIMFNNVIDLSLRESAMKADDFRQSDKLFLYIEVKKTKPALCHLYDMENAVHIGRNQNGNQICIQDITVSRDHAVIRANPDGIIIESISQNGFTGIKRGMRKTWLGYGEAAQLMPKDELIIGSVCIKIRLFRGEKEII